MLLAEIKPLLAKLLRAKRAELCQTQEAFCKRFKMSKQQYATYERLDEKSVMLDTAILLAEGIGWEFVLREKPIVKNPVGRPKTILFTRDSPPPGKQWNSDTKGFTWAPGGFTYENRLLEKTRYKEPLIPPSTEEEREIYERIAAEWPDLVPKENPGA